MEKDLIKYLNQIEESALALKLDDKIDLTKKIEKLDVVDQIKMVKWLSDNGDWSFHPVKQNIKLDQEKDQVIHCSLETHGFSMNLGVTRDNYNTFSSFSRNWQERKKEKKFIRKDHTLLALGFYFKDDPQAERQNLQALEWLKETMMPTIKQVLFLNDCHKKTNI